MEPARYVVAPHYVDKLRRWVEMAQDIEGELRAPWHLQPLQVRGRTCGRAGGVRGVGSDSASTII